MTDEERQALLKVIAEEICYQKTLSEREGLSDAHRGYIAGRAEGLRWVHERIKEIATL